MGRTTRKGGNTLTFKILAWKKGLLECKPDVFMCMTDSLTEAIKEQEKIHMTDKYYIVELLRVVKKTYTSISHEVHSGKPKVHKIEGTV